MSIVIVDYGMSNLGSIYRALEECGALNVVISEDPETLKSADRIILPGVGSFSDGMKKLADGGWVDVIRNEVLQNNIPILGICLGMQLLATTGVEGGMSLGLDLISGDVMKLIPNETKERIPHVGWNEVNYQKTNVLFDNIQSGTDFYFVHSYHFVPENINSVIATTPYCGNVVSAININNIFGTQFHPEKSTPSGFTLIKNFLNY